MKRDKSDDKTKAENKEPSQDAPQTPKPEEYLRQGSDYRPVCYLHDTPKVMSAYSTAYLSDGSYTYYRCPLCGMTARLSRPNISIPREHLSSDRFDARHKQP